jgi:polyhydroxybutyrate depolymerase
MHFATHFVMLFTLILLVALMGGSAEADQILTLATADGPRQAILLLAQKLGPNPTIIVLHGATMSAQRLVRSSGFAEAAAMHGFTAVFPEAMDQQWNDARGSTRSHADDIGFLTALARQLIDAKIADPQHLYLAGISNGGMMAFTLICEPQTPFTGIAAVVATLPAKLEASCHPPKPLAIIMMNGTADPLIPFNGGHVGFFGRRGDVLGAQQTAALFAKAEGCTGQAQQALPKLNTGEPTHVTLVTWNGCAPQASVRLFEILGGGHQIPGGPTYLPLLFGKPNHDMRAANAILEVFAGS